MKFYIEIWKAKQAWLDLSIEQRGAYMAQLGPSIQQLAEQGVEIITWADNDADTFKRVDYDFFAIWKFPTDGLAKAFEDLVNGAGWYNYFDQLNIKGNAGGPEEIIGKMINL
ncbi:hypothetical protein FFF34_015965 [Inquilinus sp. KBS0705]|nr:hypothetical protein FFF34_015965 [Inquilinus sp. KBS0705]